MEISSTRITKEPDKLLVLTDEVGEEFEIIILSKKSKSRKNIKRQRRKSRKTAKQSKKKKREK